MEYAGSTFSGVPYAGIPATYEVYIHINLLFPVSFLFYGEIGDIIFLPPGLNDDPESLLYRRSPCLMYENEVM